VSYLKRYKGQVSPVTLDIGANDLLGRINPHTCEVDTEAFYDALAKMDSNLKNTILPRLRDAMMVNGQMSGDLAVMNYYDPFQNACPGTVKLVQEFDQHLANDVQGFAVMVDVFEAFGGAKTPNTQLCTYIWMCSFFKDLHAKDAGYRIIATKFEQALKY
jgi:hypothetical protein